VAGLATRFAGSHPLAGTHVAGWAGARPDRFADAVVYVSSTGPEGDRAAREIMNFWQSVLGAHPVLIEANDHDVQLAWTSHLPQAVASALARAVSRDAGLKGASFGSGMRDTTRLAASPAEMWADIFLMNQGPVREALERMEGELAQLRSLLEHGDRAGLLAFLEEGAMFRRRLDGEPSLSNTPVPRR
jgi:prephenate dehydrogenase